MECEQGQLRIQVISGKKKKSQPPNNKTARFRPCKSFKIKYSFRQRRDVSCVMSDEILYSAGVVASQ